MSASTPGAGYDHNAAVKQQNAPAQQPAAPDITSLLAMVLMQATGLMPRATSADPAQVWQYLLSLQQGQQAAQQMGNPLLSGLMQARQQYDMGKQMDAMNISQADRNAYGLMGNPGQLPEVAQRQAEVDRMKQEYLNRYVGTGDTFNRGRSSQRPDTGWMDNLGDYRADQQKVILDHMLNVVGPQSKGVKFAQPEDAASWQSHLGGQIGGSL